MADGNIVYNHGTLVGAASGDRSAIAAVASTIINVHAYVLHNDATGGTLRWEDGAGSTALSGVMIMPAGEVIVCPFSEVPWFSTTAGVALSMEVGLGAIAGHIIYSLAS